LARFNPKTKGFIDMRPHQLHRILECEFNSTEQGHHTPVMLWGPPGVGKSQLIAEIAAKNEVPIIDIRLSQMEPSDLRGIPFRNNDQVEWAIPAMLPNEEKHGKKGILFLDEITSAPPSVSAAAYQLILDRKLGEYEVPKGWAIFAAGNRQGDRGVTYTMPAPLANRLSHFEMETHLDDWVAWAYKNNINTGLIGFLRFRPELLFDFDPAHNPVAFPSPRSWEFANRCLEKFSNMPDLLLGTLQACVGPSAGIEVHGFINSLDELPDLDKICAGDDSKVPSEIDLQYAVAAALVGRAIQASDTADAQTVIGHILDYANRFPQKEMGVMLVSDLHQAIGEQLFQVPQFTDWANKVADIMLYE